MSGGEHELLRRLAAGPVSGDHLAREEGLTRAAVWKRIEALRQAGIAIDARAGQGYVLAQPLDLLDVAVIRQALPSDIAEGVASLEVAWSLDSTNAELLRRTSEPAGTTVLLAEQQTGGRGRRGRVWTSPPACNLYLSLSRQFSGGLARLGGLSLVTGIAVAETLRALGYTQVGLKWPNDVQIQGRKLGGILIEGGGEHGGPVRAVIGLGLNVRMPAGIAGNIDQPWIDLAGVAVETPSRNALAAALITALLPALETFDSQGLAPFLPRYAPLDTLAGQAVSVHDARGVRSGIAEGIGDDGALQIRIDGQRHAVHAGEVSVRKP